MTKKYLLSFLLLSLFINLSSQKRTYDVAIMLDHTNPSVNALLEQLKKEIKAVIGEDAIVNFPAENILVNNYNLDKAKKHYEQLKLTADVIITLGLYNDILMNNQKEFPVPTMVLSSLRSEISEFETQKKTSGINNLTYIATSGTFKDDLKQLMSFSKFNKVGVLIEKPLMEIVDFQKVFENILPDIDADFKLIPYSNLGDIINNLEDIDAFYAALSFTLNDEETEKLAEILIDKKIPSFSGIRRRDVVNGYMATNAGADNYNQFLRRIALTFEAYVNGTNFSELPIYIDFNNELTVNIRTMQALDIPIRFNDIGNINFVGGEIQDPDAIKTYDIHEVINTVLNKNLSLKSGKQDVKLSEQEVKTAKSAYLPNLTTSANGTYIDPDLAEVSAGQNPEITTNGNITIEQVLFSEGANAQIHIQKSLAKAQQQSYNSSELDAIFEVSNAYLNTLILKTNLGIQVRNLEVTKRNLQIAQDNFEGGGAVKTDVLRFRSQKAQDTQAMVEAANLLHQSFAGLNFLLNNPVNYRIDIKDVSLEEGIFKNYKYDNIILVIENSSMREQFIDFMVQEALVNAPEIKRLNFNIDATLRSIKLYGSGRFLPTVGLQGQYNHEFSRSGAGSNPIPGFPDGYYSAGLNISLPIFNRNQNNINRQTSVIQKEQLEISKTNFAQLLETNIRNSISDLINNVSNIRLSKVSEDTAKESLELTQVAYSSGAVNIVQLLDAQNNYLNAQLAKSNAIYSYLISVLQVERYFGDFFLLNTKEENLQFNLRFQEFLNNNSKQQ